MFRQVMAMGLLAAATVVHAAPSIDKYTSNVKDISIHSVVASRNSEVLKNISKEFAESYRFGSSNMYYREPNQFRLSSKAGLISVTYVINGNAKVLNAGFFHKKWDLTHKPNQRQSLTTVGLMTPAFVELCNVEYTGNAKINGVDCPSFVCKYKEEPRGSYVKLFLDPDKHIITRLEQYHGDGRQKYAAQFFDPQKIAGVWVPTRSEVYNNQGQKGASTKYENLRVNAGLSNSLFDL